MIVPGCCLRNLDITGSSQHESSAFTNVDRANSITQSENKSSWHLFITEVEVNIIVDNNVQDILAHSYTIY